MSWSDKNVDFITLFVEDLDRAKAFYQDVLDLQQTYANDNSAVFRFNNTSINLLNAAAAHELIAPVAVASQNAGARLQFTIQVDDVDSVCEALGKHDVSLINGPMNRPWGIRTACFSDPGGHICEVAGPPKN